MIYKIIVSGKVQKVGYRNFIYQNALKLNIKGSVRNLKNKDVEIYFDTENEKVKEIFLNLIKKGPLFAKVENVEINKDDSKKIFQDFNIIY